MLGILDLSIVTQTLIDELTVYRTRSKLWDENDVPSDAASILISGSPPDVLRKKDGCHLSLFLFHVAVDQFSRNTYPGRAGSSQSNPDAVPGQRIPQQPLGLSLHYLVTASSHDGDKGWVEEQQAMSIALKFFHENPRITARAVKGTGDQVLSLTFEPQSVDEVGRLWQGISKPLRLSAVYRVAVVVLEPPSDPPQPKGTVKQVHVEAVPRLLGSTINADRAGVAVVVVDGAGFAKETTEVSLHDPYHAAGERDAGGRRVPQDTPLMVASGAPPGAGEFVVSPPHRIDLQVPAGTKPHGYQLLIRAAPGKPTLSFWLVVPP